MTTKIDSLSSTNKVVFKTTFFVFALLTFAFFQMQVSAASFQVAPVRANLSVKAKTSVFELHNTGTEEVSVQVNVQKWLQENGIDSLENTRDVVAVPSVFKMAPGKKQVIRVALLKPKAIDKELSYRVFFSELPDLSSKDSMKVKMRLRISVPVFIAPPIELKPNLSATDYNPADQSIMLSNSGNQHVQVLQFTGKNSSGTEINAPAGVYLLPGQARRITLQPQDGERIKQLTSLDTDVSGIIPYVGSQ